MMNDKELINHLNDQLDHLIKNKLSHTKTVCDKELALLRGSLNQATRKPSFPRGEALVDVIDTLKHLLSNIHKNISALEIECGGVLNYSLHINEQLKRLEAKIILEKGLQLMLDEIYYQRPTLRKKSTIQANYLD